MFTKSETHNPNYLAKLVKVEKLEKHPNADRLQLTKVDFQTVIAGLDAFEGMLAVFFPLECDININLLSRLNVFEDTSLNTDPTKKGFFNKKGRVRAVKLRGVPSEGYLLPLNDFLIGMNFKPIEAGDIIDFIGQEFDTFQGVQICKKYVSSLSATRVQGQKSGSKPKVSKIVEGQFALHYNTSNFRKNVNSISAGDIVSITQKLHGTSIVLSNILCKVKLNPIERLLKRFGVKIKSEAYDNVFSSRKVVKNDDIDLSKGFYSEDIWGDINQEFKHKVDPGITLYGEVVGFTKEGKHIQPGYSYGCAPGTNQFLVY